MSIVLKSLEASGSLRGIHKKENMAHSKSIYAAYSSFILNKCGLQQAHIKTNAAYNKQQARIKTNAAYNKQQARIKTNAAYNKQIFKSNKPMLK